MQAMSPALRMRSSPPWSWRSSTTGCTTERRSCSPRRASRSNPLARPRLWSLSASSRSGSKPSARAALLLQAAIQSNTQQLRGSVTTERDRFAATRLQALSPLPEGLLEAQFRARASEVLADIPGAILREDKQFMHPDGAYHVSQLELPGAGELVEECLEPLARLGARAVLNLVDVSVPASYLIAPDPSFRAWLSARARVTFVGAVSFIPDVLLRKQLVARIEGAAG